jgi:hypothetical protein
MASVPQQQPSPNKFVELSENECIKLLADHTAGRIGFMGLDGPQVLPVTYQYRFGSVIFRTSPVGALSGLARRTSVAFEIDRIDERNQSGWSVRYSDSPKKWSITVCSPPHGKQVRCPGRTEREISLLKSSRGKSAVAPYTPDRATDRPCWLSARRISALCLPKSHPCNTQHRMRAEPVEGRALHCQT